MVLGIDSDNIVEKPFLTEYPNDKERVTMGEEVDQIFLSTWCMLNGLAMTVARW